MCENQFSVEDAFEKYCDTVYRLALARTKNPFDAEDVTQTVFMKLCKNTAPFANEEHLKAWLLKVTVNTSKNLLTTAWKRLTEPLNENILGDTPEVDGTYPAVMKLSEKYRTVIHLFYYEDYSCAQIAKILDTTEATVKTRLRRAREKLGELLKGEDFGV